MPEITVEERIQNIEEFLLEDLKFDPSQVRRFYTDNVFRRTLAHIVGWTGIGAKMLRCTAAGELKTAPTSTGIEHNDTKSGDAPDTYGAMTSFSSVASRLDIFIWDNPILFVRYIDETHFDPGIEVPAGFYSIDAVTYGFILKNKTSGQTARYQIVAWW